MGDLRETFKINIHLVKWTWIQQISVKVLETLEQGDIGTNCTKISAKSLTDSLLLE